MQLTWQEPDLSKFETETHSFEFTGEYRCANAGEYFWSSIDKAIRQAKSQGTVPVPVICCVDNYERNMRRMQDIIRRTAIVVDPKCFDIDAYVDGHCDLAEVVERAVANKKTNTKGDEK